VEHIKSGDLQGLAISSPKRRPLFPNLPTFAEKGMPDFKSEAWFGLVVPRGTPEPVIHKIAADVSTVLSRPEFQKRYITGVGLEPLDQGPDEFAKFLEQDRKEYKESISKANV